MAVALFISLEPPSSTTKPFISLVPSKSFISIWISHGTAATMNSQVTRSEDRVELCEICDGISRTVAEARNPLRENVVISHHKTSKPLNRSALNGCSLCRWLLDNFSQAATATSLNNMSLEPTTFSVPPQSLWCCCTRSGGNLIESGIGNRLLEFDHFLFSGTCCSMQPLRTTLKAYWDDPIAQDNILLCRNVFKDPVEVIKRIAFPWIEACRTGHKKCRQLPNLPLPSRVLEVGNDGDDMRLRDSYCLEGP